MKLAVETSTLFSIVIPAFNRAAWLGAAIDSALAQELSPHEIIVVNDGSTDETPGVLARYSRQVKVIHQENLGLSAARNRGAREAGGIYVVYLDSDDILLPWALNILREVIRSGSRPAFVLSHGRGFRFEDELAEINFEAPHFDIWKDYLDSASVAYWIGVTGAIRRDLLLEHSGFWERAAGAEDHDFWLRLGEAGAFVYLNSPPIYAHRQHPASITRQSALVFSGIRFILNQEREGLYPGGGDRFVQRRRIIARLTTWGVTRCFQNGGFRHGYLLYLQGMKLLFMTGLARQAWRLPLIPVRIVFKNWKGYLWPKKARSINSR